MGDSTTLLERQDLTAAIEQALSLFAEAGPEREVDVSPRLPRPPGPDGTRPGRALASG